MTREFGLDVVHGTDEVVMSIRGDVDLRSRDQIAETAITLLRGEKPVVADLGEVTFIDSSGLSALLRARREADQQGNDFRVRSANGPVARLLDVTGVRQWLEGPERSASW